MNVFQTGRVVLDDGTGLFGASVRVRNVRDGDEGARIIRTARDGRFAVFVGSDADQFEVQVIDGQDHTLSDVLEVAADTPMKIVVAPEKMAEANLPIQPLGERLLGAIQLAQIQEAAAQTGTEQMFHLFECGLPPLLRLDDLEGLARGALDGVAVDQVRFRERIADLELWSTRHGLTLNAEQDAAWSKLTSDDFERLQADLRHVAFSRERLIQRQSLLPISFSAIVLCGSDFIGALRNAAVLSHQLGVLASIARLSDAAVAFLSGAARSEQFVEQLSLSFGFCPDMFQPIGLPAPQLPPPVGWHGFPDPFGPPRGGGAWVDFPEMADMLACIAEVMRDHPYLFSDSLRSATVSSISNPHACPGQEITLVGTGLRFEDSDEVTVHFPSAVRGATIPVTGRPNDDGTGITATVPADAVGGEITIRFPAAEVFVPACNWRGWAYQGGHPIRFNGGVTWIRHLGLGTAPRCSYAANEEITVTWNANNAQTALLRLVRADGAEERRYIPTTPGDGAWTFRLPAPVDDTHFTVLLDIAGHCGEDSQEIALFVRRPILNRSTLPLRPPEQHKNWHGNIRRRVRIAQIERPDDPGHDPLRALVDVVRTATRDELKLGIAGSAWSYSDCVTGGEEARGGLPEILLNLDCWDEPETAPEEVDLSNCIIDTVLPGGNTWHGALPNVVRPEARSVISPLALDRFRVAPNSDRLIQAALRLVHVKAGAKLAHINWYLYGIGAAMPTLGGSNGQSIAGVIQTGTHGANPGLPPIHDFVRAIHLVGPGGQQWWLEPSDMPITRRSEMERLIASGRLDPCLKLRYDSDLFDAALVSMGTAGVIWSLVLETVPAHMLRNETKHISRTELRRKLRQLETSADPDFFAEYVLGPGNMTVESIRTPVRNAAPVSKPDADVTIAGPIAEIVLRHLPAMMTAIPAAIEELLNLVAFGPLSLILRGFDFDFVSRIGSHIAMLENLLEMLGRFAASGADLIAAACDPRRLDDAAEDAVMAIVSLLDAIHSVRTLISDGDEIINDIHRVIISTARPIGTWQNESFVIYNEQKNVLAMKHSLFERRVESREYIMPVGDLLDFSDRVRDIAEAIRARKGLILTINLRVTGPSRALLAMQHGTGPVGHAELWTIGGMDGCTAFHEAVEDLARDRQVRPHWGHFHRRCAGGRSTDIPALYGRIGTWRREILRIQTESGASFSPFLHGFALDRNLP